MYRHNERWRKSPEGLESGHDPAAVAKSTFRREQCKWCTQGAPDGIIRSRMDPLFSQSVFAHRHIGHFSAFFRCSCL